MSVKGRKFHFLEKPEQDKILASALVKSEANCLHEQTNSEFAAKNGTFRNACEAAGVEPTKRQASKYRRGMGQARKAK